MKLQVQAIKTPAAVFTVIPKTSTSAAFLDLSITALQPDALASAKKLYQRTVQQLADIQ